MRKILFIIPSLSTGGTNSSLDALYQRIRDIYEVSVFAIAHQPRNHHYSFDDVLLPQDKVLSSIYSNFVCQKGLQRFMALFNKGIRRVFRCFGGDYGLWYSKFVVRKLEQKKFDVVVGFQEGEATRLAVLFDNPNKIGWIHCNYDKYLPSGLSELQMYTSFRKIVCVSKYTASIFVSRYSSLASRTISIPNMISEERVLQLSEDEIDDALPKEHFTTLLSVGRFSPVKRFREIPSVADSLKSMGIGFRWYVVGPGDNSVEESAFNDNLLKYGVQDSVKWLGMKANPYPYFKRSNIYVCLSESEACPMVFKEAQLFGLPIVTTDFPSSYEFVNPRDGIISSFENISESIATMINKVENGFRLPELKVDNAVILSQLRLLFN